MLKLLVVDDERAIGEILGESIQSLGHEISVVSSGHEALTLMKTSVPDIVLTDLRMDGMNGIELLHQVKESFPSVVPILMTAQGSIDTAVTAIRDGAYDYIQKPFSFEQLEQLLFRVEQKVEKQKLEQEELRAGDLLTAPSSITTRNQRMRKLLDTAKKVAMSNSTILITGESGTGKTMLAKLMHEVSPRSITGPFGVVNCATLSENLLESELFGHVRGSFTGAVKDKMGRLQAADGGTVFLDEIGEISPGLQTKLLRFLQEREFERVGDTRTMKVDVRVIAATNQNLEEQVRLGKFREDLYFRLAVIELKMPSLRDRPEDLMDLAEKFLVDSFESIGKEPRPMSPQVRHAIQAYPWPGNIRELRNAIERAAILCGPDQITAEDLPDRVYEAVAHNPLYSAQAQAIQGGVFGAAAMSLDELERKHIENVLGSTQTLEEAASILGINLSTLWRKRKQFGLS